MDEAATARLPFGYAAFGRWYDDLSAGVLAPALAEVEARLDALLHDALAERDLARIRRPAGRVKSKPRTWGKLRSPRYAGRISSLDDVPVVLDDLVGVRLTCTNRRDIEVVQEVLDALPSADDGHSPLWMDRASIRDYLTEPRPSGYRGWHVNLGLVLDGDGGRAPVTCELQVRTLLQDGWGELTHEDTYKKDGELPPLVEVLSRRMADLLATIDDIAEDLREEFDRLSAAAIADTAGAAGEVDADRDPAQASDAAAALLRRWQGLERPVDLAALAWELQREHGTEITGDWFGHGTFKRFLRHAVPEAEITTGRRAYLLPADADADADAEAEADEAPEDGEAPEDSEATGTGAPRAALELHRVDHTFPLLGSADWSRLFEHLAEAWRRVGPSPADDRLVARLVQSTCDRSAATGEPLARRHVEPVVRALVAEGEGAPRSAATLAEDVASWAQQRMVELRIVGARNRRARSEVRRWIAPATG